jgi:negative regulator of sigma-B (phosphoserine phosphatase)
MNKTPDVTMPLDWAYASRPASGESVSGDLHLVQPHESGVLVAVVDGLGHGEEAAAAARTAVGILAGQASDSIVSLLQRCHAALMGTRGVVATLASVNAKDNTVTWLGVGNVEGWVIRSGSQAGPPMESVLLRGGLVGYQLPPLQADVTPLAKGDLLVLATDGVGPDFAVEARVTQSPRVIADRILERCFRGSDDALVLVARYLGAPA